MDDNCHRVRSSGRLPAERTRTPWSLCAFRDEYRARAPLRAPLWLSQGLLVAYGRQGPRAAGNSRVRCSRPFASTGRPGGSAGVNARACGSVRRALRSWARKRDAGTELGRPCGSGPARGSCGLNGCVRPGVGMGVTTRRPQQRSSPCRPAFSPPRASALALSRRSRGKSTESRRAGGRCSCARCPASLLRCVSSRARTGCLATRRVASGAGGLYYVVVSLYCCLAVLLYCWCVDWAGVKFLGPTPGQSRASAAFPVSGRTPTFRRPLPLPLFAVRRPRRLLHCSPPRSRGQFPRNPTSVAISGLPLTAASSRSLWRFHSLDACCCSRPVCWSVCWSWSF
jgi:hypothetical protein